MATLPAIKLAQMVIEANRNAKDDADLRNKFAAIYEHARAVLRDADRLSNANRQADIDPDYGGVFDGTTVTSDADGGL